MKQVSKSEFNRMSCQEIKEGECLELTSDGNHVAYIVVGAVEDMKVQIVGRMSQIEAMRGF